MTPEEWYDKGVALFEQGKSKEAIKAFDDVIKIKPSDILLYHSNLGKLHFEFSSNLKGENIASIIRKLEKTKELSEIQEKEEIRAYILYFLGCFYYKIKDVFTAKERLEECVKLKSKIKTPAGKLLDNLWNYQIRPTWMEWWLASPLHCWIKRITFFIISISIMS